MGQSLPDGRRHTEDGSGRGTRWAGVAYEGGPGTIGAARDFAGRFLGEANSEGAALGERLVEKARLVVSELVTNAVKYAAGPCWIELRLSTDTLEIVVGDTVRTSPVPKAHDPGRVGQHGLEIVLALCTDLRVTEERTGKRVTAQLELA
jgi:anti-sigma regulatory factor (Ser/Thr protein kinase)